jgi:Lrp/AsnC family leucine-responsive transcriptional regulator
MTIKLDLKDRRLLIALDTDSTQPLGPIAKKLGLSKEATAYRIKRLENEGIIAKYITLSHFAKTGMTHYKLYAQYNSIGKQKRDSIIKYLSGINGIGWLASTEGTFDLMLSIRFRTIFEFEDFKDMFCAKFGDQLREIQFAVLTEAETKPRYYLLPEAGRLPKIFLHCDKSDPVPIDEEDWKVLRAVNTNARAPAHDIARTTGLTERVIRYRRKELEKNGIIVGSKIAIDYRKLDFLFFKCLVSFSRPDEKSYREMRTYLRLHPNVIYWIKTVGSWDAEIEIEVPNIEAFYKFIEDFKDRFSNILTRVDSVLVSKEHVIAHA